MPGKKYTRRLRRRGFRRGWGYRRSSRVYRRKTLLPKGRIARSSRLSKSYNLSGGHTTDVLYAKCKLHFVVDFSAVQACPASFTLSANDIYDPLISSTLAQHVYGYTNFAQDYKEFLVLGSKIRVKGLIMQDTGEFTAACIRLAVLPAKGAVSDFVQGDLSWARLPEIPRVRYADANFYSNNPITISHYQSVGSQRGLTSKQIFGDSTYRGVMSYDSTTHLAGGTSPVAGVYWHIMSFPINDEMGTQQTGGCYCEVDVTYYVRFSNRNVLSTVLA